MSESTRNLLLYKDAKRTTYGGKLPSLFVTMNPSDFIRLTTPSERSYRLMVGDVATPDSGRPHSLNDRYLMPYLYVDHDTGLVTQHDGRHRAVLVVNAGGKHLPVSMIFSQPATDLPPFLVGQYNKKIRISTDGMRFAQPKVPPPEEEVEPDETDAAADEILRQWRVADPWAWAMKKPPA